MRTFLTLMIIGGLGGFLYSRQHRHDAIPAAAATVASSPSPIGAPVTQARTTSEHNWMKRSLDRASDVRDQARAQTQQGQNP